MASKIVVIGCVNGALWSLVDKLAALNEKHHFSICIIAGNLFADPDKATVTEKDQVARLVKGEIEFPVPTYFALGNRPLPPAVIQKVTHDGGEVCPNLSILGRKVSIKTADGLKIVAIGGKHSPRAEDEIMDEYAPVYTDRDIESAKHFKHADILVTSEWPAGVVDGSHSKYAAQPPSGVQSLGDLVTALKPRYHFSTSIAFFEREPFFHNVPPPQPITRFLSFAAFGNEAKQKALYAFQLEASAPPPPQLPTDATASPFALTQKKRKLDSQEESFNGFRYSNGDGSQQQYNGHDRRMKRHRRNAPARKDPMACYFCISNNENEAHMVADIGTEVYLTVAKGPLTTPDTFPGLEMPCHMLIIPLQHAPTINSFDPENREATHTEMKRYRTALHNMISAKSTRGESGEAQLGAVTWEISRGGGVHLHWQFLPVPLDMVKKRLVEAAFEAEAENRKYPKFLTEPSQIEEAREGHYFRAMIWSEGYETEMLLPLSEEFNFDLQFARRVLGKLLGLESRSHWKDVVQTKEDEMADKQKFEEAFAQFKYE
ncbi:uncharacterized protein MYCFIDRAFT_189399 [Pseudocercospora fijiensis CIRAD86]|uniref:Cwf19-like C-terminal domain-containing protein n=1 Tax=Pseudocercospora fijiensis (strain CIRAD86) TaxID=383855 RepID=M3A964_PSEFD|nr:uncharacterized protein MYCFIDRAFT_189399 [Pseudocercospora fijiensis CIRAD86]EME81166.1 hypothetical protein MYCFIDRAFT_189399 [Pseudocercospora fijiensis CIRAD86]